MRLLTFFQENIDNDLKGWHLSILFLAFIICYVFIILNAQKTVKLKEECESLISKEDEMFSNYFSWSIPLMGIVFIYSLFKIIAFGFNRRIGINLMLSSKTKFQNPIFQKKMGNLVNQAEYFDEKWLWVTYSFLVFFFLLTIMTVSQSLMLLIKNNLCKCNREGFGSSVDPVPESINETLGSDEITAIVGIIFGFLTMCYITGLMTWAFNV